MTFDSPSAAAARAPQSNGQALAASRQRRILDLLRQTQELRVASLADQLDVSQETVRRDLKALEQTGKLQRVYGGAVAFRETNDTPYAERMAALSREKDAIAERVMDLDLIREGQRVFLGCGTTLLPLAQRLANHTPAKYVTNSVEIASVLARSGRHDILLTGGRVHTEYELLTGQPVLDVVGRHVFDIALTGTNGIDERLGFLDSFESEAILHGALANQCGVYVVVADHSKFGLRAEYRALALSAPDIVVTDRPPPGAFLSLFAERDVAIHWPEDQASEPVRDEPSEDRMGG